MFMRFVPFRVFSVFRGSSSVYFRTLHSIRSVAANEEFQRTREMMESNEATWYDQFYQEVQKQMGAWYWALIPDLVKELQSQNRNLVELGCGQGHILRYLVLQKFIQEENIFA